MIYIFWHIKNLKFKKFENIYSFLFIFDFLIIFLLIRKYRYI